MRHVLRSRWGRIAVVAVGVTFAVAAVFAGSVVAWYRSIDRERFRAGTLAEGSRGEPQNFLVVGSDSRRFVEDAQDAASFGTAGEVGAPRADTILLVRTLPELNRVAAVSFPRDLFVRVAGTGREDRINTALDGGPDQLVRTIGENFGVPVNHFVEVDFRGFETLVDAIGGVALAFPAPVRDWDEQKQVNPTGLDVRATGCVQLGGHEALAYVRSRHFQQLIGGSWHADPAGDLGRIARQQEFIRTTLSQSIARGLRSPVRLNSLIDVAVKNVTLDDQLGIRDLTALGRQLRSVQPESLETFSLPTVPGTTPGGADVLFLDKATAEPILEIFRGKATAAPELLPSAVRVRVVGSQARPGAADAAAFRLAAAGFALDTTAAQEAPAETTVIRHAQGAQDKAALVAARLAGPAEQQVSDQVAGADVVLVLGRDWRGVVEGVQDSAPAADAAAAPPETSVPTTSAPVASAPSC